MGIVELPLATARKLGASLDIANPLALTKELLENSIDAEATHIDILVSPNTVDKIQVRDNGLGIPPEDFDALGRRSHTSKLGTIDELQQCGIQTLGFRGQALASANSVAAITITTRAHGNPVASQLRLKPGIGGVEEKVPSSAPVGTTVKAEALFETIPVRKRYTVKESQKTMSKIKELLWAYALARPHLKLSLKVPGDSRNEWDYVPSRTVTLKDATLQIFGRELLNQCSYAEMKWDSLNHGEGDEVNVAKNIVTSMQAVLPNPGFGSTRTKVKGRFLSVNSRPLALNCGLSSRLISTLKAFLTKASGRHDASGRVSIPFMQLSIQCTPNSYDVNVAPLKDELLFAEEDKVVKCFEDLCRTIYQQPTQEEHYHGQASGQGTNCSKLPFRPAREHPTPEASPLRKDDLGLNLVMDKPQETMQVREQILNTEPETLPSGNGGTGKTRSCTRMRKAFRVNLDRTMSDATDEVSSSDEITISIPSSPMLPNICISTKRKPKNVAPLSGQLCLKEDIHRYFKPTQEHDFEIATDDTATDANQPTGNASSQPVASGKSEVRRQPLQPVGEGRLNILNNEIGDGQSPHAVDRIQSSPLSSRIINQRTSAGQRANSGRNVPRQELMFRNSPSQHTGATFEPEDLFPVRTPIRQILSMMETPPSSNIPINVSQVQSNLASNHSSSPGQRRRLGATAGISQLTARRSIDHPEETHSPLVSSRYRLNEGLDNVSPRITLPHLPKFPSSTPEQSVKIDQSRPVCRSRRLFDPRALWTPTSRPSMSMASQGHEAIRKEPLLFQLTPRTEDSLAKSDSTKPGYRNAYNVDNISRLGRRPRRRTSSMLEKVPLERIPSGYETYDLLSVIDVSAKLKSNLAEYNFMPDDLRFRCLEFDNIQASLSVERRLKMVVDPWRAEQAGNVEIEYTLQSQIKGKGTM